MNRSPATCPTSSSFTDQRGSTRGSGVTLGLVLIASLFSSVAHAAEESSDPAQQALEEFRGKKATMELIQNRFFLKGGRFEISPMAGYVPNNAFAMNYVGGAALAYHFSEQFGVEGSLLYSPYLRENGLKNLTRTLVVIAYEGNASTFQQPVHNLQLATSFAAHWAPVYGKINLIGEGVVNFDFYLNGGVGLVTMTEDIARISDCYASGSDDQACEPVDLDDNPTIAPSVSGLVGLGMNFFVNQTIAIKLDARSFLYVADEPDYGNVNPDGTPEPLDKRLYNTFVTTAGVSIFVPQMKARVFNF